MVISPRREERNWDPTVALETSPAPLLPCLTGLVGVVWLGVGLKRADKNATCTHTQHVQRKKRDTMGERMLIKLNSRLL